MKRSLRLPFSFVALIAVFSVFSIRASLRSGEVPLKGEYELRDNITATLQRIALSDPSEALIRKDVDAILSGELPPSARRIRSYAAWVRRENAFSSHYYLNHGHDSSPESRHATRLGSPGYLFSLPELRRALRDWSRARFHSGVPGTFHISDFIRLTSGSRSSRYGSCAVVGNSGILLKSEHGKMIDQHDLVIRLNNARIEGYQPFVGSKTNISFINSNVLHLCARRKQCQCHPYGDDVTTVMYICQAIHFLDYIMCDASRKSPLIITDARFDILCARVVKYYSLKRFVMENGRSPEEWAKVHDEVMFHYSSGFQAVMLAATVCDSVSIFGFGKSPLAKHHYHTNQKTELDLHDYAAEYEFYHDLATRPQAIPFLKDYRFKVPHFTIYNSFG